MTSDPIVLCDEEIFDAHIAGKLSVQTRFPLNTQRALSIAYTPGVAQVSRAIAADHPLAARYTWANRLVAVVSDGGAVLGLGDIGAAAALPVDAAARHAAIVSVVADDLAPDRIVPSPLDPRVAPAVAAAVAAAADPAE